MEVYLFPIINVVLYPSISRPITVYEPRYIQMIKNAVQNKIPIAIGFVDDSQGSSEFFYGAEVPFVRKVAGYGEPLIIEERADGSMLIFVQGRGKVRLGEALDRGTPWIVCKATKIDEVHEVDVQHQARYEILHKVFMQWLVAHMPDENQRKQFTASIRTPEEVVGCFTSYLVQDYDLQQVILEFDNINPKVAMIHRLIESGEIL